MQTLTKFALLIGALLLTNLAGADCLPFDQAKQHVGEIKCIAGKVVRVKQGARGVHFLDFCDDFRLCPFTVVVFPGDLKSVGGRSSDRGSPIRTASLWLYGTPEPCR